MVVRRIREHIASHNWFAVSVDLLILVVGIFLGTQVSNWNQARLDAKEGAIYRERMIAELKSTEEDNLMRRKSLHRAREFALAALAQLNRDQRDDTVLVGSAWSAGSRLPDQIRRSTYSELVSTGKMSILGGSDIQREVTNFHDAITIYESILNAQSPYGNRLRELVPASAADWLDTQCGEAPILSSDGAVRSRLGTCGMEHLDPSTVATASSAIRDAKDLPRHLNRLLSELKDKVGVVETLDRHSRRLRWKLESAKAH